MGIRRGSDKETVRPVPFRSLVKHAIGGGWGKEKAEPGTTPVRIIRGTDFNNIHSGHVATVPRRYETEKRIESRRLRNGDIIIEISGGSPSSNQSTGRSFFVTQDLLHQLDNVVIPASFCRLVRINEELVDPRYAYYTLQEMYSSGRVRRYEQQSTGISNFQFEFFLDQEVINLPSLQEQQHVALLLGSLDDKIRLNHLTNQILEQIARSTFQDWFVDFGPVRAKMQSQEQYLPSELWDIFPNKLIDSELGELPEGWTIRPLSEVSDVNPESWSRKNAPEEVTYVDLANTKWGAIESKQHFPWEEAPTRARRVLRPGDTLIGTVRPANGSYAIVAVEGLTGSTGFAVLRPKQPRFQEFVYFSATAPDNIERLAHLADGAAYPAVRPEIVSDTPVALPASAGEIVEYFSKSVNPILAKIEVNKTESRSLAAQRNVLLPKLISGEVKIREE